MIAWYQRQIAPDKFVVMSPGGSWLFTIVTGLGLRCPADQSQVLIAIDDVPHKLHHEISDKN